MANLKTRKNINENVKQNSKKEELKMEKKTIYKGMTESEAMKLLSELIGETDKLKAYLKIDEGAILGDLRTDQVKNRDFVVHYFGKRYTMTTFTGIVTDIKYYPQFSKTYMRARIVIRLRNGKKLSFFAWVDNYIKVNALIEATGVCIKEKGFYNFKNVGGLRRILSPCEISQLCKGKKFEELEITKIPWDIISEIKETKPMNDFEETSLKEIFVA